MRKENLSPGDGTLSMREENLLPGKENLLLREENLSLEDRLLRAEKHAYGGVILSFSPDMNAVPADFRPSPTKRFSFRSERFSSRRKRFSFLWAMRKPG